jgi:hypothetical protein
LTAVPITGRTIANVAKWVSLVDGLPRMQAAKASKRLHHASGDRQLQALDRGTRWYPMTPTVGSEFKIEQWSIAPGPESIRPPFDSLDLDEVAEYAPEAVAAVVLGLPGAELVHANEP